MRCSCRYGCKICRHLCITNFHYIQFSTNATKDNHSLILEVLIERAQYDAHIVPLRRPVTAACSPHCRLVQQLLHGSVAVRMFQQLGVERREWVS